MRSYDWGRVVEIRIQGNHIDLPAPVAGCMTRIQVRR